MIENKLPVVFQRVFASLLIRFIITGILSETSADHGNAYISRGDRKEVSPHDVYLFSSCKKIVQH